jgi:hypothetical protein
MKKLIVFIALVVMPIVIFAQNESETVFSISGDIGRSLPVQPAQFRNIWQTGLFLRIDFAKKAKILDYIVGIENDNLSLDANNKMNLISPHIGIQHSFNMNKFALVPALKMGYTWISYSVSKGIPMAINQDVLHDQGINGSIDLTLSYLITKFLQISIGDSYFGVRFDTQIDRCNYAILNRPFIGMSLSI